MVNGERADALHVPLADRRATRRLGRALAAVLHPGDLVLLEGELGSGKTFLVRAIARELGVATTIRVTSPTFALVHEFAGRIPIVHADLYRLDASADLEETGLLDRAGGGAVVLVEWGARFASQLRGGGLRIELTLSDGTRSARIEAFGEQGAERLHALAGV